MGLAAYCFHWQLSTSPLHNTADFPHKRFKSDLKPHSEVDSVIGNIREGIRLVKGGGFV